MHNIVVKSNKPLTIYCIKNCLNRGHLKFVDVDEVYCMKSCAYFEA